MRHVAVQISLDIDNREGHRAVVVRCPNIYIIYSSVVDLLCQLLLDECFHLRECGLDALGQLELVA